MRSSSGTTIGEEESEDSRDGLHLGWHIYLSASPFAPARYHVLNFVPQKSRLGAPGQDGEGFPRL
jgi:hypothetical protein